MWKKAIKVRVEWDRPVLPHGEYADTVPPNYVEVPDDIFEMYRNDLEDWLAAEYGLPVIRWGLVDVKDRVKEKLFDIDRVGDLSELRPGSIIEILLDDGFWSGSVTVVDQDQYFVHVQMAGGTRSGIDKGKMQKWINQGKVKFNYRAPGEEHVDEFAETWPDTMPKGWDQYYRESTIFDDPPEWEGEPTEFGEEEQSEPASIPRFQPGERVTFRGGQSGGTIIEEAHEFEGSWWYRVKTQTGIVQAPEEAMLRPEGYDQPGTTTLEDWGIPPQGEDYYRNAKTGWNIRRRKRQQETINAPLVPDEFRTPEERPQVARLPYETTYNPELTMRWSYHPNFDGLSVWDVRKGYHVDWQKDKNFGTDAQGYAGGIIGPFGTTIDEYHAKDPALAQEGVDAVRDFIGPEYQPQVKGYQHKLAEQIPATPQGIPATYSEDDPLDMGSAMQLVNDLDSQWWTETPDVQRQAIANAFRAALTSPRQNLMWNSIVYQDMMHIGPEVADPDHFENTIRQRKADWDKFGQQTLDLVTQHADNPQLIDYGKNAISKYMPGIWGNVRNAAVIGPYIEQLRQAALEDVAQGGTGQYFRQQLLDLNIPGIGPKIAAFVWLLLCPKTSKLATVDIHMMRALGQDAESPKNYDEYIKFENQLDQQRQAMGYNDVPLGAFQWALWDWQRTPGYHQDHTPLRPLNPVDWRNVDWAPQSRQRQQTPEPLPEGQQSLFDQPTSHWKLA